MKKLLILILSFTLLMSAGCKKEKQELPVWQKTTTLAGFNREFGEPFGLAVKDDFLYVSDGEQGKIFRVGKDGKTDLVTDKLDTPSGVAFDEQGFLIVADSGSHTIKKVNVQSGEISIVAGTEKAAGFADGEVAKALFNAPIGIAIDKGKIFVADTYNDKIRVIENGAVSTLAGSVRGFADSNIGSEAKFDTPCGIAVTKQGGLLVADLGNHRIRKIESNGKTQTLAGNDEDESADGLYSDAKFDAPVAVAVDNSGAIYVADGNSIRALGRRIFPFVETVSSERRGYSDGAYQASRFNRPSGLAFDASGNLLIADSENQTVRIIGGEKFGAEISAEQISKLRYTAEEFRQLQPPRWTYDPPNARRDVAGTLGEIRGEIAENKNSWFHNGLDIAGNYGETARFVRTEKVLRPLAAENFGTLRELLRLPTLGYIHIRLGRDQNEKPFNDQRFQFSLKEDGKFKNVRVPRGSKFEAGDVLGTLNRMNHVHLIAGRSGAEMNALAALVFPNISDTIAPTIEKVGLFDENWREFETKTDNSRIKLPAGKIRIVVRAFDQMNGNAGYRKLGVYRLGYQILKDDKTAVGELKQTISFAGLPDETAVKFVYAPGSQSGYSPQTIFDYIVTNEIHDGIVKEDFFDTSEIEAGNYVIRVFAADFFGNNSEKYLNIEIFR